MRNTARQSDKWISKYADRPQRKWINSICQMLESWMKVTFFTVAGTQQSLCVCVRARARACYIQEYVHSICISVNHVTMALCAVPLSCYNVRTPITPTCVSPTSLMHNSFRPSPWGDVCVGPCPMIWNYSSFLFLWSLTFAGTYNIQSQ